MTTFKPIFIKSLFLIVPYLTGIALSSTILPQGESSASVANGVRNSNDEERLDTQTSSFKDLSYAIHRNGEAEPCGSTFNNIETTLISLLSQKNLINESTLNDKSKNIFEKLQDVDVSKHEVDSILTVLFGKHLLPSSSCGPEQPPKSIKGRNQRQAWGRGLNYKIHGVESSFLTFCDMGTDHTPILHDHDELIPLDAGKGVETLPCHFHTREGLRITSFESFFLSVEAQKGEHCDDSENGAQTCEMSQMMHLYAVPAGRLFMFAPSFIGETFVLNHVEPPPGNSNPVKLRVLSLSPRVFDLVDFFKEDESTAIVHKALKETSESHRIKRSSTGASGYNLNSQRTSENGFDTHGLTAIGQCLKTYLRIGLFLLLIFEYLSPHLYHTMYFAMFSCQRVSFPFFNYITSTETIHSTNYNFITHRRSLHMLGFDEYVESYTDGLQVLRYNKTTAYIPHLDWIDSPGSSNSHDFLSAGVGTNRFATVLLYMTNLEDGDGGETVFKHGWPMGLAAEERRERNDVLQELRQSGEVNFLKKGSWVRIFDSSLFLFYFYNFLESKELT